MLFALFPRKKVAAESLNDWPFHSPRNEAVFTTDRVIGGQQPILRVVHGATDGGWQFLPGDAVTTAEAKLVSLGSIATLDPTVLELASLPEGWCATRSSLSASWVRTQGEPV